MPIPPYSVPIPSQYPCSKQLISCKPSISYKSLALYVGFAGFLNVREAEVWGTDDFPGCPVVGEVEVWGTAVVVTAVKALTVDSTGRTLRVLDSTGEGVSVVDCVTDDFGGETAVDLRSCRFWGIVTAVDLCSCRFRGCGSCRYVAADFGSEAAVDLSNCRF